MYQSSMSQQKYAFSKGKLLHAINSVKRKSYASLLGDRRCKFYDLSKKKGSNRKPESSVLQFYSSADNIGNFMPVLGIQELLGFSPDTWCIHDKKIDFDFINKSYKCLIIGGAGLLADCFEEFWKSLNDECNIPVIIWGVGACVKIGTDLPKSYINNVGSFGKKCVLINVRDRLTAEMFGFEEASITTCPTVIYLRRFRNSVESLSGKLIYSSHERNVSSQKRAEIKNILERTAPDFEMTDHIQHPYLGLEDIIKKFYLSSECVFTSRLHGAITAYGLGIPYIAFATDEKVPSFQREYGNGIFIEKIDQLEDVLSNRSKIISRMTLNKVDYERHDEFADKVKQYLKSIAVQS
jgi:hypothetical protein